MSKIMKMITISIFINISVMMGMTSLSAATTGSTVFQGEGADDTAWMNMLTMVAVGAAARGMSACQTKSYDALGAAASGGIYLWGELSTLKSSKGMKSQSYTYKLNQDGTLVDSDKTALKAMRSNYVDARGNLKTKKSMQKYAGYGWMGSAAYAGYKHYDLSEERESCENELNASVINCAIEVGNDPTKMLELNKLKEATEALPGIEKIEEEIEFSTDHSDKLAKSVDDFHAKIKDNTLKCKDSALTACNLFVEDYKAGLNRCSDAMKKEAKSDELPTSAEPKSSSFNQEEIIRDYFRLRGMPGFYDDVINHLVHVESFGVLKVDMVTLLLREMFLPSAQAGMAEFLGLAGVGIGVYTGLKAEKSMFIDKYLSTYKNRAYVFAAMSLLAFASASETEGQIAIIDSNINKIDSILKAEVGGTGTTITPGTGIGGPAYSPSYTPIVIPPQTEDLPCANVNCDPVSGVVENQMKQDPDLEKLQNIPSSTPILQSIKNATALADDMKTNGKLSKASLDKLDGIGTSQNALTKALGELERKFGSKNKNAFNPFSLNGEKLARDLAGEKLAKTLLVPEKVEAGAVVESPSSGSLSNKSLKDRGNHIMSNDVYYMPAVNSNRKDLGESQNSSEDVSLDVNTEEALSKYENSGSDIGSENGPSLWAVITNRYLKSATEKLLIPKEEGK